MASAPTPEELDAIEAQAENDPAPAPATAKPTGTRAPRTRKPVKRALAQSVHVRTEDGTVVVYAEGDEPEDEHIALIGEHAYEPPRS